MVCFQIFENILTSLQFMKKDKNIVWKITDQFFFCQYLVKYFRKSYLAKFLSSLRKINYSLQISLCFVSMTPVAISFDHLSKTSILVLTAIYLFGHEGLPYKLENIGILGSLLTLFQSFLSKTF